MIKETSAVNFRQNLGEMLNQVQYRRDSIVINKDDGTGEAQAGLRKKEAILGDVCEAIIAAVWLDAGWDAARTVVERAFGPKMTEPGRSRRDAKSTLQEWALARGLAVPDYVLAERAGPDHAPRFRVAATIAGYEPCEGEGLSKRMAEQAAAQAFLVREGLIEEERA